MLKQFKNPIILLPLLCALFYSPFSAKPLHIDGPVTVYMARQMLQNPVDPPLGAYGALLAQWNHTGLPVTSAFYATPHPPLVPLYLMPFIALFGERESILNWAMFPFYAVATLLCFALCGLFFPAVRWQASLLFATSPLVFVNAQNVMVDLPLAVFCMAALLCAFRSDRSSGALLAGLFAALACLTKFTGGAAVVAILWYYARGKRWKEGVLFLVPLTLLCGAWMIHNLVHWGTIQLSSSDHARYIAGDLRYRFERMISYLGGTLALPPLLALLLLFHKKYRAMTVIALSGALLWSILLMIHLHYSAWSALVYTLCAGAGAALTAGCLFPPEKDRRFNALAVFTFVNIVGGLFLTLYASRYLLPFAVIPVLVIASIVDRYAAKKWIWAALIALNSIIAVLLSIGDYQYAAAEKQVAVDVRERFGNERVHFKGRLGYLHYMHQAGFLAASTEGNDIRPGDLLVRNESNQDDATLFSDTARLQPVVELDYPLFPMRTMTGRAGFYGNDRLPYAWITKPSVRVFRVYRVR